MPRIIRKNATPTPAADAAALLAMVQALSAQVAALTAAPKATPAKVADPNGPGSDRSASGQVLADWKGIEPLGIPGSEEGDEIVQVNGYRYFDKNAGKLSPERNILVMRKADGSFNTFSPKSQSAESGIVKTLIDWAQVGVASETEEVAE